LVAVAIWSMNVLALPDQAIAAVLSQLNVPDLWAASKSSAVFRQVSEAADQAVWRISLFNSYYRGHTFKARLPDDGVWDCLDDKSPATKQWPAVASVQGGTKDKSQWTYERCSGVDVVPFNVTEQCYEVRKIADVSGRAELSSSELPPNSRDFANKDIRAFFAAASTQAELSGLRWKNQCLEYLVKLAEAGREGWKAFALRVHFSCDPAGRRAILEHESRMMKEDPNLREHAAKLERLMTRGWSPSPGMLPLDCDCSDGFRFMFWNGYHSILLIPNMDLAPGVVVFKYVSCTGEAADSSELECASYLGPTLGRSLDLNLHRAWKEDDWNRFFRLMFLCNANGTRVCYEALTEPGFPTFRPLAATMGADDLVPAVAGPGGAPRPGRSNPFSTAAVVQAAAGGSVYDDMATVAVAPTPPLSVDAVVANLHARLVAGDLYTRVGGRCMVAVNPCLASAAPAGVNPEVVDATSKAHAAWSRLTDPSKKRSTLLAEAGVATVHVFDIATTAYFHMARGQEDQTILLMGEAGSGKSESFRMVVRNLCDLSKASKKKSKVHSAVLRAESVLQSFGHACNAVNSDASCFTRYTEFQFNNQGRMMGAKYISYLLDKSRVSGAEDGGRSFNIFYYLLAGATHEEKQQWQLGDTAHYHYLSNSSIRVSFEDSPTALDTLRENLKALGVGKKQQVQIFQLMAAILHMGNISFIDDTTKSDEPCTVKNYHQLALVADLLGVHPTTLETTLTYKTITIGRDAVSVFLDARGAAEQRDALARALYAIVFNYLIEQINKKLCQPEAAWSNFIAVVEVPGFASGELPGSSATTLQRSVRSTGPAECVSNGFYRLLINFANEKLLDFVNRQLFDLPRDVLAAEELQQTPYPRTNPTIVLNLLEGSSTSILPLCDAEAVRGTKDSRTTERIIAEHGPSSSSPSSIFSVSTGKTKHSFMVRHTFKSVVEYDTHGFADKNLDVLQSDFVTLIRGNPEQSGTSSPFLRSLFSDRLIATLTHAKDSRTVVAAQAKTRHPSLRRKKGPGADDEVDSVDPSSTVGYQFRKSFKELLEIIGETQTSFVFHIRASEDYGGKFDAAYVKKQVEPFDIQTIAESPSVVYTAALGHTDFLARFSTVLSDFPLDNGPLSSGSPRTKCDALIRAAGWTSAQARNGKTRIFLAENEWRLFEDRLRASEDAERRARGEASEVGSEFGGRARATSSAGDFDSDAGSAAGDATNAFSDIDASEMESNFATDYGTKGGTFSTRGGASTMPKGGHTLASRNVDPSAIEMGLITPPETKRGLFRKKPAASAAPRKPLTRARKQWLCLTWCCTWWIPPFCLSCCGMKRHERQIAFREKLALCIMILLMNAFVLFLIIGLGLILCPKTNVLSPGEIESYTSATSSALVFMYGNYYSAYSEFQSHVTSEGASAS
ncbi:hypothetical protein HK405_003443, partial [Cladochytrium tenue]